jgi:hypothetical protein
MSNVEPIIITTQHRPADPSAPERKMWACVLRQALVDLGDDGSVKGEAKRWLTSSSVLPYSFRWVCDVVRIHPDKVIRRLKEEKWHIKGLGPLYTKGIRLGAFDDRRRYT